MLCCISGIAQNTLAEGFFRVQNMASGRFLYVRDCTGEISTLGADIDAIELWLGQENTVTDPACVMYFKKYGSQWNIQSQATGLYEVISHYMTISTYNGGYVVYDSGQYLYDITKNNTTPRGKLGAKTDSEMKGYTSYKKWNILPINSSDDSYFGLKPTVYAAGSYYTTFYADFAFTPKTENTKVWYVSNIDKKYGIAVISQLNGTISRSQPVIIQSTSPDPSDNRVDLTIAAGSSASGNKLLGVYFSNGDRSFEKHPGNPACVEFDSQTMRMLGKNADGKLAFINNPADLIETEIDPGTGTWRPAKVIPHNQAYLNVDSDCPASLLVMTETEYEDYIAAQKTYTLTYVVDGELYKQYSLKSGAPITPEPDPVRTGYTFSGWSGILDVMPAGDITVTGSFTVNYYTIKYVYKDKQVNSVTLAFDESIPEYKYQPDSDTGTIYTFVEWQENGERFTLTRMPARNIVLVAVIEETPTSISSVVKMDSKTVFDLQGLPVSTKVRGRIYIVNGRKYLHR